MRGDRAQRAPARAQSRRATLPAFLVLIGALLALFALLFPVSEAEAQTASAAGTLDQRHEGAGETTFPFGEPWGNDGSVWAQTFTAGLTGDLDHVELLLRRTTCDPGPLTVEIRATDDRGEPISTEPLATTTVQSSSVPDSHFGWAEARFTLPAPSVAGTQYAMVLSEPRGDSCTYAWSTPESGTYPGGEMHGSNDGGSSWGWGYETNPWSSMDANFRTYVVDTTPPPPPAKQCADGKDNDSDGKVDYPSDQGCSSAEDNTEAPDPPQCSDRVDNDSDRKNNFPNDPGCSSASDNDESDDPTPARECTIMGTTGNDVIRATSRADVICADNGDDRVYGAGGDDRIWGGPGNDILRGEGGGDAIYGGPGKDVLRGEAGRDYLAGTDGDDQLFGGAANDRLVGGTGGDELFGNDGADSLTTRDSVEGNDAADGDAGDDSCETDRGDRRSSC